MAKTIEEIFKDLEEWREENPEQRNFVAIVGHEEEKVSLVVEGQRQGLVTSVASEIAREKDLSDIISEATRMALRYTHEK